MLAVSNFNSQLRNMRSQNQTNANSLSQKKSNVSFGGFVLKGENLCHAEINDVFSAFTRSVEKPSTVVNSADGWHLKTFLKTGYLDIVDPETYKILDHKDTFQISSDVFGEKRVKYEKVLKNILTKMGFDFEEKTLPDTLNSGQLAVIAKHEQEQVINNYLNTFGFNFTEETPKSEIFKQLGNMSVKDLSKMRDRIQHHATISQNATGEEIYESVREFIIRNLPEYDFSTGDRVLNSGLILNERHADKYMTKLARLGKLDSMA